MLPPLLLASQPVARLAPCCDVPARAPAPCPTASQVPMHSASGVRVQYLKVWEKVSKTWQALAPARPCLPMPGACPPRCTACLAPSVPGAAACSSCPSPSPFFVVLLHPSLHPACFSPQSSYKVDKWVRKLCKVRRWLSSVLVGLPVVRRCCCCPAAACAQQVHGPRACRAAAPTNAMRCPRPALPPAERRLPDTAVSAAACSGLAKHVLCRARWHLAAARPLPRPAMQCARLHFCSTFALPDLYLPSRFDFVCN